MQWNRVLTISLLAGAATVAACDDPIGPLTISDFQGNWTASSVTYTAHADPARAVDIVPLGGGLTLNLDAAGNYQGVLTLPTAQGPQPIPITGTVTLVSDTQADIVFNWPQGVPPQIDNFRATFTLQGNNLTFSRTDTSFHFFGQEAAEPANLLIVMSR
jgi:hypothetical protein